MADRVAVKAYGAPAFKRGLTHVVRRSLESQLEMNQKLDDAMHGEELIQFRKTGLLRSNESS